MIYYARILEQANPNPILWSFTLEIDYSWKSSPKSSNSNFYHSGSIPIPVSSMSVTNILFSNFSITSTYFKIVWLPLMLLES